MLCEKPVGRPVEEAKDLRAAVERSGNVFQVDHMKRFDTGLQAGKALVDNEIGMLFALKAWYCDSTTSIW